MKASNRGAIPYGILSHITDPDKPATWTVHKIRPGKSDECIVEEMAEYFIQIMDEFDPLDTRCIPSTYTSPFPEVLPHEVASRICSSKKPKSPVWGDPLPSCLNTVSDLIAIPATHVMNLALSSFQWPDGWKFETQTAIPKNASPKSFAELQNISCTNYLSKVLESFVLDKLKNEVKIKYNQFGGIKGTGTAHCIIDVQQRILDCLEEGRLAVS